MWSAVREFKVVNPWARSARLQYGTEGERQQAGRLYTKLSMYRVEQRGVGQSVSLHSMAIYGQTDFFFLLLLPLRCLHLQDVSSSL